MTSPDEWFCFLVADICVFDCIMKAVTHQPCLLVGPSGKKRESLEGRRSVCDSNGMPHSQTRRKFPAPARLSPDRTSTSRTEALR